MKLLLLVLASFISLSFCAETTVKINVQNAISKFSDRFISYEIDFAEMMDLYREQHSLANLNLISPAYLKLRGFLAYLKKENVDNYDDIEVASLLQGLNSFHITPVIVIDYNVTHFEPVKMMEQLKQARDLKLERCVWQLGESDVNLDDKNALKLYADDLRTLKILCESVKKDNKLDWEVAAVMSALKSVEKLPFDVLGYDLKKSSKAEILSKSFSILPRPKAPRWMTVEQSSEANSTSPVDASLKANEICNHECLINGLLHAQVLGEAAGKDYDVLFFEQSASKSFLSKSNNNEKAFEKAVTILHKKLVGQKSFNVRVKKSSPGGNLMNLYSFCSKKTNGAITLMGINFSNMRAKYNVKLSTPIDANTVIVQYLLSASDGNIMLNNERFNSEATPSYKFKKLSKFAINLVLPPFSMAFWTVKNAKVNECLHNVDVTTKEEASVMSSSTDKLLKKLAANEFEGKKSNALEKQKRVKRQLGGPSAQYLPQFELELPPFKFPSILTSASNHKPIRDVLFNKNTDVYKVAPVENPLQPSENPTLPSGDVYLLVSDGSQDLPEGEHADYVIEENDGPKRSKSQRKKGSGNQIVYRETSEAPDYFHPYEYVERPEKKSRKLAKKAKQETFEDVGELFEVEMPTAQNNRYNDQSRSASQNVELTSIIRELEPTVRQSKTAMLAAKRKWDRSQIMELLKDAQLEEVDKAQLENADDLQMIDLTDRQEFDSSEYEDEDDALFFDEKPSKHYRSKRDVDYTRNEIPKFGAHVFDDEDDSIESLVDVHLPKSGYTIESEEYHEASTQTANTTTAPIVAKAVNIISSSLNGVIEVAGKAFINLWKTFAETPME